MENKEFEDIIKNILKDAHNQGKLNEGFDRNEFMGAARKAAMQDIGDEFVPLGKSKFEKGMDTDEFISDLERQNLGLPNDEKELEKLAKSLDTKKKHEKAFGAGSINETGEWNGDAEDMQMIRSLKINLEMVRDNLNPGLTMEIGEIKGFDKYQGPYADIKINGEPFTAWLIDGDMLWIEDFPIDNTSGEGKRAGFEGFPHDVAIAINKQYSILSHMNEGEESEIELPHFDTKSLYHYLKDAFYTLKDYDYAEAAQILEKTMKRDFKIEGINLNEVSPYIENPNVNTKTKISRPKDAEGQPITLMARVEDLKTGAVGKVARFGVNGNGQLVVDIHWIAGDAPKGKSLPTDIVVRDTQRVVREDEMEEGMGHSHTIGHGKNAKPEGYPETLLEDDLEEGDGHSYTIGKGTNAKPANYPEDLEEDFDFAAAERQHHDMEYFNDAESLVGKEIKIINMDEISDKLFGNNKRIASILDGIKEEIASHRIKNNIIVATDNMDTEWLFDVVDTDGDTIKLEFTGIAK